MTIVDDRATRSWSISDCARYRYSLTLRWGSGERLITWVLLNPSMVDEMVDDPTTRRVGEFSRRWGYNRLEIVNLFALRAVRPEELSSVEDPVGPKNLAFVRHAITNAELVVVGWGDGIQHAVSQPETLDEVVRLRRANTAMLCFGVTEAGHPLHPGSLDRSSIPLVWTPQRAPLNKPFPTAS
jgi:hypothetical protein